MRLFVAIPAGAETRKDLESLVARLRRPADGLRWTAPAGWHITLVFLGEATAEQLHRLTRELATVEWSPFPINFITPEVFDRAGALVVGVQLSAQLAALQRAVSDATAACGFTPETRAYRPHLTLARTRRGDKVRLHLHGLKPPRGSMAREFVLYESFLEPGGARYLARVRFESKS